MTQEEHAASALPPSPTSNGVLPLEALWPTPKMVLEGYSRQVKALVDGLGKGCREQAAPEVLDVPGAREALTGLDESISEARRLLLAAGAAFERLADTAPSTRPFPSAPTGRGSWRSTRARKTCAATAATLAAGSLRPTAGVARRTGAA